MASLSFFATLSDSTYNILLYYLLLCCFSIVLQSLLLPSSSIAITITFCHATSPLYCNPSCCPPAHQLLHTPNLSRYIKMQLHNQFNSILEAQEAIRRYVLDNGESFKLAKSDKRQFSIGCKDAKCGFGIRASKSSKEVVSITVFKPHTCSPVVYYKNKQAHSVVYLLGHHQASIINNRKITATQIRSNERLLFNNEISYQ